MLNLVKLRARVSASVRSMYAPRAWLRPGSDQAVARRIGAVLRKPVHVAGHDVLVCASIGIADAHDSPGGADELLDFGTGYSSLQYLKRFPVDTLKIDKSFVDGLGADEQDTAIVQSIVALAKTLRLDVTGEGIETAVQQAQLRLLAVERGQGYLFARPQPADVLGRLLLHQDGIPDSQSVA